MFEFFVILFLFCIYFRLGTIIKVLKQSLPGDSNNFPKSV